MKYLRRNNDDTTAVPLQTSLEDFKKARFGNSKIGSGVAKLTTKGAPSNIAAANPVKPLLTREELSFLNRHGEE